MKTSEANLVQSLRAIQEFLDAHVSVLASVSASGARKKLDQYVTLLSEHSRTQSGGTLAAKGARQKTLALRHFLMREFMAPIARIAAADLPHTPELAALKLPKGSARFATLHQAATGMAVAARPFASVFTEAGLPADFISQMLAAADAMIASIGHQIQSRGASNGATKGIGQISSVARKNVRVLDALVRRVVRDPALLRNWVVVKRPRKQGVLPGVVTLTGTTTAAVPAPAPASATAPKAAAAA